MWELLIAATLILMGVTAGVFVVVVIGIRIEDTRGSTTGHAPGRMTAGVRRVLGLHVDHTGCLYVSNPEHACPRCRRAFYPPRMMR
ncbi:hypothetical protein ACFFMN_30100 [Planobispora siamensis]|uniref:hypothetical protein n=1 Tax=Planobispora siamensis TaxID=936338 RepID=UPI0019505E8E|nr:hypothetical protein [Planobispora siamensis]